jgi:hypothetical protein
MSAHIAAETKATWTARARRNAHSKMESLLEFRTLLNDAKAEGYPPIMELYAEAASAMECAVDTLRRDIATIREYSPAQLSIWIVRGISFDHMETANSLAEIAHKAPADLIHEAIDPGNATGETMTVKELQAHALGERPMPAPMYWVNRALSSFGGIPQRMNWNEEKTQRWNEILEQIREFFK